MAKEARLVQGNQAMAEGAIYAGARFYAGYPITPSSEIAEECSKVMLKVGGVYMQMEDEIASIAAVIGASLTGAKAFTATSGPGFSLMQENLGLAVMGEVPCVVIDVQRCGPSTGLATKPAQSDIMQLRWGRHGDQIVIALCPATVNECFALTVTAFNFAEKFRVPVILAPDEIVGHMRENFSVPEPGEIAVIDRKKPSVSADRYLPFAADADGVAPLAAYGSDYVFHVSSSMHGRDGYSNNDPANAAWRVAQLHRKIEMHQDEIVLTKSFAVEDADVLLIAYGATTRAGRAAAMEARKQGIKAGVLQLVTLWPFADKEVAALAKKAKTVVVPEMNYSGQVAGEVRRVLGSGAEIRRVNSYNGEIISPQDILKAIV
ncbi:MAG: 2-oxoacid:acceptor oxidoreductase subunit alpha [Proteobacteria bacterium]|nr:2-oxoacid:acceptor oxidoreductase subunit alpha [Pseudomonadota bacterium]MBU2227882.1 2-oxoacid:acceptor oxidoreductase subunit alpha [Pseudomonadota bacterium]MBU2261758.1 2-oxoacid:acceptor oxidoreductase subunit alpha [Pseudomonadota bacterium]